MHNRTESREARELRALLAAVLEALDIPHPATVGDTEAHDRILVERVSHAKIALRGVLEEDEHPLGVGWTTTYLRERLSEHPATGYRSWDDTESARQHEEDPAAAARIDRHVDRIMTALQSVPPAARTEPPISQSLEGASPAVVSWVQQLNDYVTAQQDPEKALDTVAAALRRGGDA